VKWVFAESALVGVHSYTWRTVTAFEVCVLVEAHGLLIFCLGSDAIKFERSATVGNLVQILKDDFDLER